MSVEKIIDQINLDTQNEINQILKTQYQLVNDCFGLAWADSFCVINTSKRNDIFPAEILNIGLCIHIPQYSHKGE